MLNREIKITLDGSKTLFLEAWNESYHSKHGALQEALHVFIENGVNKFKHLENIRVLEFGFGTGLNTLLTSIWATQFNKNIHYTSLEKFPLTWDEVKSLDFHHIISQKNKELRADTIYDNFIKIHESPWGNSLKIHDYFELYKHCIDFKDVKLSANEYDIVYFDVFGKRVQPELWTVEIFAKIFQSLKSGGMLTTYASNSQTRRLLEECGFEVEKLKGPPGKREMMNAWKK